MVNLAKSLRTPVRTIARVVQVWRSKAVIVMLKLKGCKIAWTAVIHHNAVIELSGGTISIGSRTHIDHGVILRAMGGHICIGADCGVNAYSFLSGGGGIDIDDHVMIGSHVSIYASNHVFEKTSLPMDAQGLDQKGIQIERDVWIGTGVRILDGVRIASGSILAAGAVISKSTIPFSINGGVPARIIGTRKHDGDISSL